MRRVRSIFHRSKKPAPKLETQDPPIPSLPDTRITSCTTQQPHPGFFSLPTEIRDLIMIEAFGNVRVHIDLRLLPPRRENRPSLNSKRHGGPYPPLDTEQYHWGSHLRTWKWYSCVCHSCSPSLGQEYDIMPHHDECLRGPHRCLKGNTTASRHCRLGIIGFMMSCKQA